mgnify:CR=1 FL=1
MAGWRGHSIWRRFALAAAFCLMENGAHWQVASAAGLSPEEVKVSMLYNFPKFVDWPPYASPEMVLCVLGSDPLGSVLDSLNGKPLKDKTLSVRRIASATQSRICHVLFVPASESGDLPSLLKILRDMPVLTVSDMEGAAAQGIMIEIVVVEQRRLGFKINLKAARQSRLEISSQLLKLAQTIY